MATWFECKVKYEKLTENGQQKAVLNHIWLMPCRLLRLRLEL